MAEEWNKFLNEAKNPALKDVLRQLKLSTVGNKTALKIRLQEAVKDFPVQQLLEIIHNGNNGNLNDDDYDENHTSDDDNNSHDDDEDDVIDDNDIDENVNEELSRLRKLLKRKREIARLKQELEKLQYEEKHTSVTPCSFKDIEDSVPNFSGDDNLSIQRWIELFEEISETMELNERTKFIYGKRLLSGTAKLFCRTIVLRTWKDLKKALLNEFKKRTSEADLHNELRNRRKHRDETLQQYLLSMQEIASAGSIDEEDLIEYIVKGIPDAEINKVLLYSANNLKELKTAIRKYEKLKTNSRDNTQRTKEFTERKKTNEYNGTLRKIKCFNCNQHGHLSKDCCKPKRKESKCFKCGKSDHMANACKGSVMVLQHSTQDELSHNNYQNQSADTEGQCHATIKSIYFSNNFEHNLTYNFFKGDDKCNIQLLTLFDSGSAISFVQEEYVPAFMIASTVPDRRSFCGINGSPLVILGSVNCKILYDNSLINFNLFVVRKNTTNYSVILGRDFIDKNNLVLKRKNNINETVVKENGNDFIHASTDSKNDISDEDDFVAQILNINVSDTNKLDIPLNVNQKLPFHIQSEIKEILNPILCVRDNLEYKIYENFEMKIKLTKEDPFYCTARRLPYAHKIELQKILDGLLAEGIIRESDSPFVSPIVLVKKKTGEFRLCVDFRELNKVTLRDHFPLPLIEDHLDRLRDKRFFTTLDLKNAFHHVKIAEDSIKYTSFITPLGQYEYTRMPFGLKNAPSVFERYMRHIFGKLASSGKVLTFIDDILIATATIEEHLDILKEVVEIIKENCLQLRLDKCSFLQNEITYLGYKVNGNGIRPTEDHLKAVNDFPIPTCTKDVHSFLGLCSYFRKFIKDFASISKSLYDLLKKNVPFVFGKNEYETFKLLKRKLIESPVLSIYNPKSDTELHCDASSIGYGAVLLQRQSDKKYHPVFYFSKRVSEAESRYHSFELETLAIIYALRRFRVYLIGIEFKIVTDCQSLSLTLNRKLLNPRISRWALELQSYNYTIEHRKAERMSHADALSRSVNILSIDDASFEFVLAAAQKQDSRIVDIASELEKKESSEFEMIDGLIYRKKKDKILFYVPEHMESHVIRTHHEALGHLGVEKCYDFLTRTYWFPKMKQKIKKHISSCLKCLYFSPVSGKSEGTLHNIPKGNAPFDTLHIDHYGPLANSRTKKQYIFLIVDAFTKYTKLYGVKTTQTKEVIVCLESYFEHYSRPCRIVSDRGTAFTSKEFNDFLKSEGINHIMIASQCPQANGQAERINRILTPMLSKLCESDSTLDWDKHLMKIEFALNNTVNRSTGFTPSMLLFGTDQKGKLCDRVMEYLKEKNIINREDLEAIRHQASVNIEKSQNYNKKYYDKVHKCPTRYKKGDYVMIKNITNLPGVNKKLFAKFKGPYEIEKVISEDRYLIKDIDGLQLTRIPYKGICAPQNMKPFVAQSGECMNKE